MFVFACKNFFGGVLIGAITASVFGLSLLYALNTTGIAVFHLPEWLGVSKVLDYAYNNLRLSVIPFMILMIWYGYLLLKLNRLLIQEQADVTLVSHTEQLLDSCITLFFGVGVLFTAIGMRSALMFALGNPEAAAADGAFAMLQRMVNGGILLALSTTIVGGTIGYLMRVLKSLYLGELLQRFYQQVIQSQQQQGQDTLLRIEHYLQQLVQAEAGR